MEEIDEALTTSQRLKRRAVMRQNRSKIRLAEAKSARKKAPKEVLVKRSIKAARELLSKKLAGGKSKSELSFSERERIEKKLASKKGAIKELAKKLFKVISAKEKAKFDKKQNT